MKINQLLEYAVKNSAYYRNIINNNQGDTGQQADTKSESGK